MKAALVIGATCAVAGLVILGLAHAFSTMGKDVSDTGFDDDEFYEELQRLFNEQDD
jgi:hypothetical protein